MSLIEDVLSAQDNYISNKIKIANHMAEYRRIEEYEARDRLSVSSFEGFTGCVKELIASRKKPRRFAMKTLPKLKWGTALHTVYQSFVSSTPNLQACKPWNFPYDDVEYSKKLDEIYPELPVRFRHPVSGKVLISGYLDGVINYHKDLAVVDYKFTGVEPQIFKSKFEQQVLQKKYLFQAKYYLWRLQQDGYYLPLIPTHWCLYFVNYRFEAGDPDSEREVWGTLTDEERVMFLALEAEVVRLDDNPKAECAYRYCKDHGSDSSRSQLDELNNDTDEVGSRG